MLQIFSTLQRPLSKVGLKQTHTILKKAYEVTEVEIWGLDYDRLFIKDFKILTDEGNIFIAYLDDIIVGCVHIYSKNNNTYTFSLLAVDFNYAGQGIGTALVNRVEEEAKNNGASQIKIEILRVKKLDVPHKIRLAKYYESLGYSYTHSEDSECIIPDWKYKLLIAPSNFDFYTKKL